MCLHKVDLYFYYGVSFVSKLKKSICTQYNYYVYFIKYDSEGSEIEASESLVAKKGVLL